MKEEVSNVRWPFCQLQLFMFGYKSKVNISICASKIFESQELQNEALHIQK